MREMTRRKSATSTRAKQQGASTVAINSGDNDAARSDSKPSKEMPELPSSAHGKDLRQPSRSDENNENILTPPQPPGRHTVFAGASCELSPTPPSALQSHSDNFGSVSQARMTSTPYTPRSLPSPKLDCSDASFSEPSSGSESVSKRLSSIIESLPSLTSPSSSPVRTEPWKKIVLADVPQLDILKGVRAFVEVRDGTQDMSSGLVVLMERLGATVLKRMSRTVTHVVFRHGRRSTRKKSLEWNIPMVTALWVIESTLQNRRVPESEYPAKIPPEFDLPKIPKQFKVLQWCTKDLAEKYGLTMTPPKKTKKNVASRPSPRAVRATVTTPPQVADNTVPMPESPKTPRGRRSLRTVLLKQRAETFKKDIANHSPIVERSTDEPPGGGDVVPSKLTADTCEPQPAQNPIRRRHLFTQSTPEGTPPSLIIAQTPPPITHIRSFFDEEDDEELIPLRKRIEADRGDRSETLASDEVLPRIDYYRYLLNISDEERGSEDENSPEGKGVVQNAGKGSESTQKRKRKQTSPGEKTLKKRKGTDGSVVSKAAPQDAHHLDESEKHSSVEDFQMDAHKRRSLKALSWLCSSADDSGQDVPSLVLTSVKPSDEEAVKGVVQALGSFKVDEEVSQSTTHVICGEKKRTLKMLFAMAQGCWVLSPKWAYESLERGKWLPEEPYEVAGYFPAIKSSRLRRGKSTPQHLFTGLGCIYISPSTVLPYDKLRLLVERAGGKVSQSYLKCEIAVGPVPPAKKFGAVTHVTEKWILDSISEHRTLPVEDYCF